LSYTRIAKIIRAKRDQEQDGLQGVQDHSVFS